jgi:hypothetical protein
MNALLDIKQLFGSGTGYVNGEVHNTDAHKVSEYWGYDYRFWATAWFVFAVVTTLVGLLFSRDAREWKRSKPGGGFIPHPPNRFMYHCGIYSGTRSRISNSILGTTCVYLKFNFLQRLSQSRNCSNYLK